MGRGPFQPVRDARNVIGADSPFNAIVQGIAEGTTAINVGVYGSSESNVAVWGRSQKREGVLGETNSPDTAAISAMNHNPEGGGAAIFAKKEGSKGHAGFFVGNVFISEELMVKGVLKALNDVIIEGDLKVLKDVILPQDSADCAEDFDVQEGAPVEPGCVMVVGDDGRLQPCDAAYDKRVAGVISGGGAYRSGIVLDRHPQGNRLPIALVGKVYCRVDAGFSSVRVGDLLTTSPTRGHAMKVDEPAKAFGTVIGKALAPLDLGRGLVPILVALQ